ncbi:MAG: phosphoribosylamine---glycine ligase [Actinomycetota bacterium]|nr:phosphoribosylamine---glycine ligase [Actinomycetota bacterium]
MRVLVIGSGGREHALAHALARSPSVDEVIGAPGNPGIATLGPCLPVAAADPGAVADLADEVSADLVVVGPEVPLVAGVVDAVEARGRLAFGPRAAAAQLEGSKAWMKDVLHEAGVPTARYGVFANDSNGRGGEAAALNFLDTMGGLYVVKTDGLAAGKGVVVTTDRGEAREAVRAYLSGKAFGDAGRTVVIEEGLSGPELSLLVLCDGRDAVPLAPAQDFKRIGDGDAGPNTGGMGAYSPVPLVAPDVVEEVMAKAVAPTLETLGRRGAPYRGVLYAGIMLTPDGPKILEYNVRFGDPECQVVIPRLASDLGAHLAEAAAGRLATPLQWRDEAAVTVVLASEGYPAAPRTGDVITGLEAAAAVEGVTVFHAGTVSGDHPGEPGSSGEIRTAGGRVLNVTALGATLAEARARAYAAAACISWPGMQYRRDIAGAAAGDPGSGGAS